MGTQSKTYTDEFKTQIVKLHAAGKTSKEPENEYGVSKTTINTWVKQYGNSGKFGRTENMTEAGKELKALRKENKQLRMENDILKQAAVIFAGKDG